MGLALVGQLRTSGLGGATGVDLTSYLSMGRTMQISDRLLAEMYRYVESGLLAAVKSRQDEPDGAT